MWITFWDGYGTCDALTFEKERINIANTTNRIFAIIS